MSQLQKPGDCLIRINGKMSIAILRHTEWQFKPVRRCFDLSFSIKFNVSPFERKLN